MFYNPPRYIIIFFILVFFSSFFVVPKFSLAAEAMTLPDYLTYFYHRYAKNFDEHGWVFKMPGYGVEEFSAPDSARRYLSVAAYYRYDTLLNDQSAREKIRQAILAAQKDLAARPAATHSFADAFAQMAILTLTDDIPYLLTDEELAAICEAIKARAKSGILAPDTSNRAALSAVYWQAIVNNLAGKKLLASEEKNYLDSLIYQKIKKVMAADIDELGWYREGASAIFNPHYHLITAFALASYSSLTGDIESYLLAKKMTANLRTITFQNGMVEAKLGSRPVGLGAQFYLGAGLLNAYYGYDDYAVYLSYGYGDRFFSDKNYPNRLEYHSTLINTPANYHDDLSFSNLAELALLNPTFRHLVFGLDKNKKLNQAPLNLAAADINIINNGTTITYNNLEFRLRPDGDSTTVKKVK